MTPIRLFCKEDLLINTRIKLYNVNYIINVMKRKLGDEIILINGRDGEFLSIIEYANKQAIDVKVVKKLKDYYSGKYLGLIFAPIQKIDLLAKNATENGVSEFIPFKSQYTQYSNKLDRIEDNVIEAIEQSERLDFPKINKQKPLKEILDNLDPKKSIVLFCEERKEDNNILSVLDSIDDKKRVYIIVGPEGGFSDDEKKLINSYSFVCSINLGKNILRAETAVTVSCSILSIFLNK